MNRHSALFQAVFPLPDLDATHRLGARIAAVLKPGDTVTLSGDLGAGKTTLARAILAGLGVDENVPSPSFTLVQSYSTPRLTVSHFDLYRLKHARELDELGLEEALETGAALIEWPERAEGRLPPDALHIALAASGPDSRIATINGPAKWAKYFEGAHVA